MVPHAFQVLAAEAERLQAPVDGGLMDPQVPGGLRHIATRLVEYLGQAFSGKLPGARLRCMPYRLPLGSQWFDRRPIPD